MIQNGPPNVAALKKSPRFIRIRMVAMQSLVWLAIVGCGSDAEQSANVQAQDAAAHATNSPPDSGMMEKKKFPDPKDIKFMDSVESNVQPPGDVSELQFVSKDGSPILMADYLGKTNIVLVFTEGFNGILCPFCQTQTSRLVANYDEFKKRNCEVIVVYPGPKDHLDEFVNAALKTEKTQVDKVPFPIVLDTQFAATKFFEIESNHAHPSTYLIDKQGGVQFAYVGKDMTADRPSVKAILNKLDTLKQ